MQSSSPHAKESEVVEGMGRRRLEVGSAVAVALMVSASLLAVGVDALSEDGVRLLAIKRGMALEEGTLSDWNESDADPCGWSGVECDPGSARVVSLRVVGGVGRRGRCRAEDGGRPWGKLGQLGGTLSKEIWDLSELRRLSIPFNGLRGELSGAVARLKLLRVLDLDDNRFEGRIPAELSSCRSLHRLSLANNALSGTIPGSLGSLPRLTHLSLSGNRLGGRIPPSLFTSCNLKTLDLSGNSLSGAIPPEIAACARLRWVFLSFNALEGTIPPALGRLSRLKGLELAGNSLTGAVPAQLAECSDLEYLVLGSWSACVNRTRENRFRGPLPPGLSDLPKLRVFWAPGDWVAESKALDSGSDALGGGVRQPPFLRGSGVDFNFCAMGLLGGFCENSPCGFAFPKGFGSRSQTAAVGNWGVGGDAYNGENGGEGIGPQKRRMALTDYEDSYTGTEGPTAARRSKHQLNSVIVAAIAAGCAVVAVIVVLGFAFQCSKHRGGASRGRAPARRKGGRKVVVTFPNETHNLTYEGVVRATGNFSIDNLIGSGGFGATYKAEVKPGLLVAVKRLAMGRFQGVQQFDTEIRTLGRIRHPNLVTLIGYHASKEDMFLVYNYFSQGNLETVLHSHKEHMDWKTRHSVAFRIAEALAFLHGCCPKVLHRDIKPSNILLDEDWNAHLSDFGLARLLGASETHATTDVAGTFGYVAPEYAVTCRVTDKADVYSFGVVLLELLSGKRALDPSFCVYGDGFTIVSWACLLIKQGRAPEVFNVRLWEGGHEKGLLETLKLAVLCTVEQLSARPTMREVAYALGRIRPGASIAT